MNNRQHSPDIKIEIGPSERDRLQVYGRLYDFYSPLLTEKQSTCFSLHYFEDYSMAEVGEVLGITPQAAWDQVRRSVKILEDYEKKLSLFESWQKRHNRQGKIVDICEMLARLIEQGHLQEEVKTEMAELMEKLTTELNSITE